ncbi:hypothetical protein BO71DRAFT_478954 [Aspergillus ellipticus CBS 707.79]|uniref:Uncharacterized protein n=1 Tax=Aspergillus ellipticus CBS 707.79 TaxID=1448320 RepID=A0A319DQX3_9EURO|nr:hypothetical protein BO71DRAFT_478954 [Aspergillus ellipticus CBS 707.79]
MDTQPGILAILQLPECAGIIYNGLDRRSLKRLRLTGKKLDDLVVSRLCSLFNRVYVSANRTDLEVLYCISRNPRIAPCVRELVWDVSIGINGWEFDCSNPLVNQDVKRQIIEDYHKISEEGYDFKILVQVLPQLSGLKKVIFVSLMSRWVVLVHGPSHTLTTCIPPVSYIHPTRPQSQPLESPAMRKWHKLQMQPVLHDRYPSQHEAQEITSSSSLDQLRAMLVQPDVEPMRDFLKAIQYRSDRAPILLLEAFSTFPIPILSYSIEASQTLSSCINLPPEVSDQLFRGIDLVPFLRRNLLYYQSRSFRHLCLSLDSKMDAYELRNWHRYFHTESLQTTEVRVYETVEFHPDMLQAQFPVLRKLVLDNFSVTKKHLEDDLLPWCFKNKLQTLHLVESEFLTPARLTEMKFFHWLLAHDISEPVAALNLTDDVDTSNAVFKEGHSENNTSRGARSSQSRSIADDDFESAIPFLNGELDDASNSRDINYKPYRMDELSEIDDDHDDDTQSIYDELPMPPVRAEVARHLLCITRESFEFRFCGRTRGCEDTELHVLVDGFQSREE